MWQQVHEEVGGPDFELISVAVDPTGPDAPRPYLKAAGVTFPATVDATGATSVAFGFQVVPNGILVDASGVIRFRMDGGFSSARAEHRDLVRAFARGEDVAAGPALTALPYNLAAMELELVRTKMALGHELAATGRPDAAIAEWTDALHLDPENRTIRKAIWAIRFPERFHPIIDTPWQAAQLATERAAEIAAGYCGPDGCPLPRFGSEAVGQA